MRGIQQPEYRGCAEMLYEVGFRHECQAADSGVNAIGPQWLALIRDLVAGELTQLYIAGEVLLTSRDHIQCLRFRSLLRRSGGNH